MRLLPWIVVVLALGGSGAAFVLTTKRFKAQLEASKDALEKAEAAASTAEHERVRVQAELDAERKNIAAAEAIAAHHERENAALAYAKSEAEHALAESWRRGASSVELDGETLVIDIETARLFTPATLELHEKGEKLLRTLVQNVLRAGHPVVEICSHTDDQPVPVMWRGRFLSNWDLTATAGTAILHFLETDLGVPGEHLRVVAFGHTKPLSTANTAAARQRNRRIELRISGFDPAPVASAHEEPKKPASHD